jgi:TonB family protein
MAGKHETTLKVDHYVGDELRKSYTFRSGPVVFGSSKLSLVPVEGLGEGIEAARIEYRDDGTLRVEALVPEPQLALNRRYATTGEVRDRDELAIGSNTYRVRVLKGFVVEQVKDEGAGYALEVALFWGNSVLAMQNYTKPREIKIGEVGKTDFLVPVECLGEKEYTLVRGFGDDFFLNMKKTDLDGRILIGNEIFTFDEVRKQTLLKENAYLKITPQTRVRLFLKHLSVLISYKPMPKAGKKMATSWSIDTILFWSISLFLHLALLIAMNLVPEEELRAQKFFEKKKNPLIEVVVQQHKKEEKKEEKIEKKIDEKMAKEAAEKDQAGNQNNDKKEEIKSDDLRSKLNMDERKEYDKNIALNTGLARVMGQQTALMSDLMNGGMKDWGGPNSGNRLAVQVAGNGDWGGGLDPFGGGASMGGGGGFRGTAMSFQGGYGGGGIGGIGRDAGTDANLNIKGSGVKQIKLYGQDAEVSGKLDKELIQKIIRRHMPEIKWCYQQGLQKNSKLEGKVVVNFTISSVGKVIQTGIKQSTMHNDEVEQCVLNKISRWKFPEPKGGGIVGVNYPFIFKTTE